MKKKPENTSVTINVRKKRGSWKNKNKKLKLLPKSTNVQLKGSLINSNKNLLNSVNVGLRRSSRKAAIERRVWTEPYREKSWNLNNKECISGAKRGRPRKRNNGRKIFFTDVCKDKSDPDPQKKCRNESYFRNACDGNSVDKIENGFHSSRDDKVITQVVSDDDNREGTLIIDDDVTSLHGAVVDEVVKDYAHKSPNNLGNFNSSSSSSSSCKASTKSNQSLSSYSHFYTKENDLCNHSFKSNKETFEGDNKSEVSETRPFCTKNDFQANNAFISQNALSVKTSYSNRSNDTPVVVDVNKIENEILNKSHDGMRSRSNQGESNDDENHVSLSEALAKLIESEVPGEDNEPETVTIHPVSFSGDIKLPYKTQIDKRFENAISSTNEISHILNAPPPHSKNCNSSENNDKELGLAATSSSLTSYNKKVENYECSDDIVCNKISMTIDANKERDENIRSLSAKQPVPGLLKLTNKSSLRAPAIRTPLKCPVCPMRFCTVRSLLWHFGTHEPCHNRKLKNEVLLENLVTSWDKPDLPLYLSKRSEELNSERNFSNCKESPFSSLSLSCKSKFDNSLKLCNKESSSNSISANRDFILKVPIPKLSYYKNIESFSESNHCYNYTALSHPDTSKPSLSPIPCVSILPLPSHVPRTSTPDTSFSLTLATCNSKSCVDKTNINTDFSFHSLTPSPTLSTFSTTQHDIVSSSHSSPNHFSPIKIPEKSSGAKSHVTVIPVEKLDQLRSQINKDTNSYDNLVDPKSYSHATKPRDVVTESILEDSGLVVINKSLSLRIMNTSSTSSIPHLNCSGSDSLSGNSCLTILPQSKKDCSKTTGKSPTISTPDILTIVPQIKSNKSISNDSPNPSPPQLITAVGKVTADSSQIVNLILVPPKEKSNNLVETELTVDKEIKNYCEISDADTSTDIESEEGEMVIDMKEEETASMDPLSLCAVTMEDEDNETKITFANSVLQPLLSNESAVNSNKANSKHSSSPVDDEKYLKRKYVCGFCHKRFGWSTDLKRHIILHTGERPFKCKWCPITFTRKFLLQNHMKKIHTQFCKWSDLWE